MAVVVDPRPLAVSRVVAADSLPWLLLACRLAPSRTALPGAHSWPSRISLRAVAILGGAFLILGDRMTLALLILVVLINSGGRAVYYSSLQAVVPDVVDSDGARARQRRPDRH